MVFILSDMERKMSEKIMGEYVQWCLSVPAMWDEGAKSAMRTAAEMAGMVQGPHSKGTGSPHDLIIVLEPEAAALFSFYHITSSQIN